MAEDEIKEFQSVEELIDEIKSDRSLDAYVSYRSLRNRFPVRFIMIDKLDDFQRLLQVMEQELNVDIFKLETLLEKEDDWITSGNVLNNIKKLIKETKKSTVVSPLSEIIRFFDSEKINALFKSIALLTNQQNDSQRRFYIPLIGFEVQFNRFLSAFSRKGECAPVWTVKTTNDFSRYTIYLANPDLKLEKVKVPNFCNLKTTTAWLSFFGTENFPSEKKIVCSSKTINAMYDGIDDPEPDNVFNIKKIETAFAFIRDCLGMEELNNIKYKEGEEEFWRSFCFKISESNNFSFEDFVKDQFNVKDLKTGELLKKWGSSGKEEHWMLKCYYSLYLQQGHSYLSEVIDDLPDYSFYSLSKNIAMSIFTDGKATESNIKERNELLNMFDPNQINSCLKDDLSDMEEKILDIENKEGIKKAVSFCPGVFDFEKKHFLRWYVAGELGDSALKELYPDLSDYLAEVGYLRVGEERNWINEYIQFYKKAKINCSNKGGVIVNILYSQLKEIWKLISEYNASANTFYGWYYHIKSVKDLLKEDKSDKIYWIDGLGIEYLSLIEKIITEKSEFAIEKMEIARVDIPSDTNHNQYKNICNIDKKIDGLDNFYHESDSSYSEFIHEEIKIIKRIFLEDIFNQKTDTTITIISDHGATILPHFCDRMPLPDKVEKETSKKGQRYIELDEKRAHTESFICHKNENNGHYYAVAIKHATFCSRPAVREVHGGCAPEEILVPFIVISNKKKSTNTIPDAPQKATESVASRNKQKKKGFEEEELFRFD